jgi:hypothetical protein
MAELSSEAMAIVVSTGHVIDYCFMSDELTEFSGIDWIKKGQKVPRDTATWRFNADPENIQKCRQIVGAPSTLPIWFGGVRDVQLLEDVIGLGSYGKTLTILYEIELPDADEEDEEEEMRDSWSARFSR